MFYNEISWEYLINDINDTLYYNKYCYNKNYYDIFKNIIISMLIENEIILIDYNFTKYELINIIGEYDINKFNISIDKLNIKDKYELINKLKNTGNNWKITLFTSGTTGIPKKVSHNFNSITKFIKFSDNEYIWGYAYNPTHMAGIQVFLQCLLNGNHMIKLFELTPNIIYEELERNKITNISATPTFYKMLLPCDKKFLSVKNITFGGEKLNQKLLNQIINIFPNAKIRNIYASTELGSILSSDSDIFTIKQEYNNLIKIKDGELLLDINNCNNWFYTGDLVEILSQEPLSFKFKSRKNEMINVGGYKINPEEIEDSILKLQDVTDVYVYSKNNSILGNIICCDIVSNMNEYSIRTYLQNEIQEIKIPRFFNFVNNITANRMNRTGKRL